MLRTKRRLLEPQQKLAIRHLGEFGHQAEPRFGDVLYGGTAYPGLIEFFLHAAEIRLPRADGSTLAIVAPLPADRLAALASLGG